MLKVLGKLPNQNVAIAFSGGVDSVVLTDFILRGNRSPILLFMNHGTEASKEALGFVKQFATNRNLELHVGDISSEKKKSESWEEYWRKERYSFFAKFSEYTILTAHHLDDAVETWLWRCLNGTPRTIAYRNGNIIRPFLLNTKAKIRQYAEEKQLTWVEDCSNIDLRYTRNKIRHNLVPIAFDIQPGLYKVVTKQILKEKHA